jgi:salicylate hydroxylase
MARDRKVIRIMGGGGFGDSSLRVAIVGAGIGGAITGVALQRAGVDVRIYEQAAQLEEVGAGVVLSPNATRILDRLKLGKDFLRRAVKPEFLHLRRWSDGRTISRQPLGEESRARYGGPYVTVHRADLIDAIASSHREGTVYFGRRVAELHQDGGGVDLTFEDGGTVDADVVLGADGIRSTVASAIGIPTIPRASGYAAYRALIPAERIADLGIATEQTAWLGPSHHFVHYFVSGGERLNCVAIVPSPNEEESWTRVGDVADARAEFADWHSDVRQILERVEHTMLWGLYDRPTRSEWHAGRVALVGDAAHPMLPFFAQGAAQAIEDAAVLAHMLADARREDVDERLAEYSALRVPRARRIQELSFRNATMFHLPDGPEQEARDARIADASGGDPFRDNAWLYEYDVDEHLARVGPGATSGAPSD